MSKKENSKTRISKLKILIFVIILLLLILSLVQRDERNEKMEKIVEVKDSNVEKYSKNSLYNGIGQEIVEGKDGYDTTFTSNNNKKYKEYKQIGNASWKNKSYWGGTFEENGCGLAAIATLASGYNLNYTPEDLRRKYINFNGMHLEGDQMSGEIQKTLGIKNTDFLYADIYFKKEYIFKHLKEDRPILVCVWNKPNDKWTTSSHYMLLLATDMQDKVYVSNPNGLYGNIKMSGWYGAEEILPYIAKAMFINQ